MPVVENKTEALNNENQDQFASALSYVKNKLKNLNIRKKNLELLKDKVDAGKQADLQLEQVQAVTKLPEVDAQLQQLDKVLERLQRARELHVRHEKQLKQQQKQRQLEREQLKLQRVLLVQEVLSRLDDRLCSVLLSESGGGGDSPTEQLTELVLEQLQQMAALITPARAGKDTPFQEQLALASDHLIRLADASQKKVAGTTYAALSRAIDMIVASGVLDTDTTDLSPRQQQQQSPREDDPEAEVEEDEVIEDDKVDSMSPTLAGNVQIETASDTDVFPSENGHGLVESAGVSPASADGPVGDREVCPPSSVLSEPASISQQDTVLEDVDQTPQTQANVLPASQPSIQFLQDSELTMTDPALLDPAVVSCTTNTVPPPTSDSLPTIDNTALYVPPSPTASSTAAVISSQTFTNSSLATECAPPIEVTPIGAAVNQSTSWADDSDWAQHGAATADAGGECSAWSKPPQPQEGETETAVHSEWINSGRNSDNGRRGGSRYRGGPRGGRGDSGHNGFHSGGGGGQSGGFGGSSTGGGGYRGGRPYRGGGGGAYGGRRGSGGPSGGYRRGGGERGGYRGGATRGSRGSTTQ